MQRILLISLVFLFSSFSTADNKKIKRPLKPVSPKEALENYNYNKNKNDQVPSFGPTKGLVLEKVESDDVFEKLGLKSGDNVISYDRLPLKSPKDGIDFYKKAEKQQVKIMLIERNGEQRNLYVK